MTSVIVTEAPATWETAVSDWPRTRAHRVLRAYGDELNARLAEAWLSDRPRPRALLKTDLFDEAVGEGLYPRLRRLADHVVGVDVSSAVVTAARARYPQLDARVADVRRLPFGDGAIDAVVSFSTLDHFDSSADIGAGIAELERVLAPGGRLLVTLDNAANPLVAVRNAIPWRALSMIRLVPCYVGATCTPAALAGQLRSAGLTPVRSTALMHVPRVAVLGIGAVRPARSTVRRLAACEGPLGALPSRNVTGQFVAALAVKPA